MSDLREIQESFQRYVQHGEKAKIGESVTDQPHAEADVRLYIYREGYYLRLVDILEREFSGLQKYIGADEFSTWCHDYIDAFPSNHFNVRLYGRHFVNFLQTYQSAEQIHVELAEFEWAIGKALDDADAPTLTLDDMSAIPPEAWENLRVQIHPTARYVPLSYNTPALWQALHDDAALPELTKADQAIVWVVWRKALQSHYTSLSEAAHWMMQALQAGKTFTEVCDGLCEYMAPEDVPQFAGGVLRDWLIDGIICGFES